MNEVEFNGRRGVNASRATAGIAVAIAAISAGCSNTPLPNDRAAQVALDLTAGDLDAAAAEEGGESTTDGDAAAELSPDGGACITQSLALAVSPASSGRVLPHTTSVFDVTVSNTDSAACGSQLLLFEPSPLPAGFFLFADPTFAIVGPGQRAHFAVAVTATTEAVPGAYELPFEIAGSDSRVAGEIEYVLQGAMGCFVRPSRELFVRDVSVVDDPERTRYDRASSDPRPGAWTFGRLMERMAPTTALAPAFVERLFQTWLGDQSVGGFTVPARPSMDAFLLHSWPRLSDGTLDLTRAPLRLLAIVNRIDTRSLANGRAGEGRFVFGVLGEGQFADPFTLILEYRLPASSEADVLAWARAWHDLGSLPFPSEAFNAGLEVITDRFASRGADPRGVSGSALAAIRTNEVALGFPWELRQFRLSPADGFSEEIPVDLTPDTSFVSDSVTLADFINRNERSILAGDYVVLQNFEGAPFLGGSSFNNLEAWNAPGIANPDARRNFALNTCNGCHGTPDVGTLFLHVAPRDAGQPADLSGFLQGAAIPDPVTGSLRTFNDLGRRKADLERLVCDCLPELDAELLSDGLAVTDSEPSRRFPSCRGIGEGIRRVH